MAETFESFVAILRRQMLIIGGAAALGLLCGVAYLLLTPRVYTATAEILFDRGNHPVVSPQAALAEAPFDAGFFDSQLKVLQSEHIALPVIRKLGLTKTPEFASGGWFRSDDARTEAEREQQALGVFLQKISAKRVGATFFIEVSFQSGDAQLAERIVDAVAEEFIADQKQAKYDVTRQANDWLHQRLEDLRRKAAEDEQAVNAYKTDNKIVNAGGSLIGEQALSALNLELVAARTKMSDALARLDRIEAVLRLRNPDAALDATVSDALSSPIIIKLRQDYLALSARTAEYTVRYGANHQAVQALRVKMRGIQNSILSEVRRLAEVSKSEYLIAKQRRANIEQELAATVSQSQETNRAQVTLRDLESAAQSSRSLYNLFQQRFLESTQQQSSLFSDVRVITPASATNQKRAPKVLALSMLGGLALGVALGLFREASDRVFRTSKQVENILRVPCVALAPFQPEMATSPLQRGVAEQPAALREGPRIISYRSPSLAALSGAEFAHFTEAVRSIKLATDLNIKTSIERDGEKRGAVIGIASSLPGEGKSTIAVALAQLAAQLGRRVLVVDCDLRRPALSRTLAPGATTGLLELLFEQRPIADAVWTDPDCGLDFVPIVANARQIDAYDLLGSEMTERLFEKFRRSYDYIIVDLPPIIPIADVRATADLVDFYFMIVEWGRTKTDIVVRALSSVDGFFDKLVGVVLNKVDMDYIGRYDSYDYRNYYSHDDA